MKKAVAFIFVAAGVVALTLVGVLGLGRVSAHISLIANPAFRAISTFAELFAAVLWLLGIAFVATRLAVAIFTEPSQSPTTPD